MKIPYLSLIIIVVVLISCKKKEAETNEIVADQVENIAENATPSAETNTMVYFKGGEINIGSNNGPENEKPIFKKIIAPFYLDKNLVTVAEFRVFITKTGYKTDADKFGDSGVFSFETNSWSLTPGANWEFPLGKENSKAADNHPVTHVSWNDANAYAKWIGKRLPTEFEWEFAAKNGQNTANKYAWGPTLVVNSKFMANVWEGKTVMEKTVLDGFLLTSPVGNYGVLDSGLSDMGGNVWQWCENDFESYPGSNLKEPANASVKSTRGGSFMYDEAGVNSYTTTFRGKNSIDTSLFNMGFRCAK